MHIYGWCCMYVNYGILRSTATYIFIEDFGFLDSDETIFNFFKEIFGHLLEYFNLW